MKIPKKYRFSLISLLILLVFIIMTIVKQNRTKREIVENKKISVALVHKLIDKRTITRVYYKYYFEGNEFKSNELTSLNVTDKIVDKYFEVDISTKNPSHSRIQLDKEVTDTELIKK